TQTGCVRHEKRRGHFFLSPREERAGRELERGELMKTSLLSPALSSLFVEEREKRSAAAPQANTCRTESITDLAPTSLARRRLGGDDDARTKRFKSSAQIGVVPRKVFDESSSFLSATGADQEVGEVAD